MKIGPFKISFPHHKVTEKYKAAYEPSATAKPKRKTFYPGQYSWAARCSHYDKITEQYSLAKVAPFTLAGLVTANGAFFKPSEKKPQKKSNKKDLQLEDNTLVEQDAQTYALAEEAQYRAEKMWREQRGNGKFYETSWRMAQYGGCFWEITTEPTFGWRIPTMQEYIEPYEADEQGNITKWRQIVHGVTLAEWTNNELILVPFLGVKTATWPFAPSIFTGTETELEMLTGVEESANEYSKKQAWPYEILQLGDKEQGFQVSDEEYNEARSEWKSREPGGGLVTTVPSNLIAGGTGSAPIRELAVLCELMKDNVQDSVMIAPISKLYNSTEASAKEMTKHIMTVLGQPMQWRLAEYFESYVLKPWLEASGFSRKSCPQTVFESPDVHKGEEGQYWTSLVSAKIQTPQQACDHLGLEYDEAYWRQEEVKQQEQFQQKIDASAQKQEQKPTVQPQEQPIKVGESWLVQKVKKPMGAGKQTPFATVTEADEEGRWITINGVHIQIKDGESVSDAFERTTGKKLTDKDLNNRWVTRDENGKVIDVEPEESSKKFSVKNTSTLRSKVLSDVPDEYKDRIKIVNVVRNPDGSYDHEAEGKIDTVGNIQIKNILPSTMPGSQEEYDAAVNTMTYNVYHEIGHQVYRDNFGGEHGKDVIPIEDYADQYAEDQMKKLMAKRKVKPERSRDT